MIYHKLAHHHMAVPPSLCITSQDQRCSNFCISWATAKPAVQLCMCVCPQFLLHTCRRGLCSTQQLYQLLVCNLLLACHSQDMCRPNAHTFLVESVPATSPLLGAHCIVAASALCCQLCPAVLCSLLSYVVLILPLLCHRAAHNRCVIGVLFNHCHSTFAACICLPFSPSYFITCLHC
jgi:hypothetical protein